MINELRALENLDMVLTRSTRDPDHRDVEPARGPPSRRRTSRALCAPRFAIRCGCFAAVADRRVSRRGCRIAGHREGAATRATPSRTCVPEAAQSQPTTPTRRWRPSSSGWWSRCRKARSSSRSTSGSHSGASGPSCCAGTGSARWSLPSPAPTRSPCPTRRGGRLPDHRSRGRLAELRRGRGPASTAARSLEHLRGARTAPPTASGSPTPSRVRSTRWPAVRGLVRRRSTSSQPTAADACWKPRQPRVPDLSVGAEGRAVARVRRRRVPRGPARLVQPSISPPRPASPGAAARRRRPRSPRASYRRRIQFDGMPNTRWWAFEEGAVNLGDVNARHHRPQQAAARRVRPRLRQRLVPAAHRLPVGQRGGHRGARRHERVRRALLDRAGGERAGRELAALGDVQADVARRRRRPIAACCCSTTAPESLESEPVEDVDARPRRGVEHGVGHRDRGAAARRVLARGREAALELRGRFEAALEATLAGLPASPDPAPNDATIRYELDEQRRRELDPVRARAVAGDNREIQLQRAAMPRLLQGDPAPAPDKVRPRTTMLREGLDAMPRRPFYLAEEEVARAGVHVWRKWQRVRGRDGRVVLWLGMQRRTGRGEGSSGLQYDQMRPKPKA